jgi:hypothetical protein
MGQRLCPTRYETPAASIDDITGKHFAPQYNHPAVKSACAFFRSQKNNVPMPEHVAREVPFIHRALQFHLSR